MLVCADIVEHYTRLSEWNPQSSFCLVAITLPRSTGLEVGWVTTSFIGIDSLTRRGVFQNTTSNCPFNAKGKS